MRAGLLLPGLMALFFLIAVGIRAFVSLGMDEGAGDEDSSAGESGNCPSVIRRHS